MKTSTKFMQGWLAGLLLLSTATFAQQSEKVRASEAKVTVDLLRVQEQGTSAVLDLKAPAKQARVGQQETIRIEAIVVDGQDAATLLAQLQALGLTEGVYEKRIVSGLLPIDKIDELKNLSALRFARPSYEPINNVGLTTTQADRAMKADVARQMYNVTGRGSKIGVLSDSYNARGGAPAGVASGDLPANVQVIDDYLVASASDEGRAMIELVHDLAPDAAIAFNTAFRSQVAFAKGIRDLAAAGCNIIVDDVFYFAEPYFQDGILAQAVDEVKSKGVTYFSSAGNHARNSYQNAYSEFTPFAGPFANDPYLGAHNFGGGDIRHLVTVPARSSIRMGLQWDNPFASVSGGAGAQTDMDLLVYRNNVFQSSLSGYSNNLGGDPLELVSLTNNTAAPVTFELVIAHYAGPAPSLVKWIAFTNGLSINFEYPTNSSTCVGHANAAGAIATGAAYYRNTPVYNSALTTAVIEGFSSAGGTPILFNVAGQRIGTIIRQKPEITAADGGNTTFFTSDADGDGFPNFFGTSAAAPHAAAVAALMQQQNTATPLTPDRIVAVLEQTALDMDDPLTAGFDVGFDFRTGYGFIQADQAVLAVTPPPTLANAIPNQAGKVGQAYSYMIPTNTFTDPNYTFSQLTLAVRGLPPGLTFTSPATISGTPLTTVGSPFSVTVTATNPAGLSVATTFQFTIEPPVTPLLTVLHRDVDNYADNNAIQPLLQLQNNSNLSFPYSALTLRYYVTVENASALTNLSVNYAQVGGQNVRLRYVPLDPVQQGAQGYVEVGFTEGAGSLVPGANSGALQLYFAKGDYGTLNELDDYSYNPVRNQLTGNLRITAYYNGILIAGQEPGSSGNNTQIRAVRALTESKNGPSATQISTYLEVRNEGNVALNYSDLKARYYFTADGNERLQVEVDEGNVSTQLVKLSTPVNGADTYLEIRFNQGGQLAPGATTGTIRYRISKPDGGRFNQANDYSYQEQPQDRAQNSRVVVYSGNERLWGQEPGGSARVAYAEAGTELTIKVLGNPIQNDQVSFEVTGAEGQALQLQLLTPQGRVVNQQLVPGGEATQRHQLSVTGQAGGLLLLQVSTPTQSRTVKVIKAH